MFEDPKLAAQSRQQNPADVWNNRPASLPASNVTSHSSNGGFARAVVEDGRVVATEASSTHVRTSTRDVNASQNAAAGVPYDYAVDPNTHCRLAPHEVQENSIVYVGGASMTLSQARAAGFLPPGWRPNGTYPDQVQQQSSERLDNSTGPLYFDKPQDQPEQEVHPDLAAVAFADKDAEQSLNTIIASTGGMEQLSAVKEIVENGEISEATLNTLATQLQVEPSKLQEGFAPVMAEFERQGRAVFSQGGLDADEVIAYAQQNERDALRRAMHQQAKTRSTAGYAELRQSFLASLGETNPERALQADLGPGNTVFRDAKGKVMVRTRIGEMAWRQAVEAFGPK